MLALARSHNRRMLRSTNVALHVLAGTLALLLGFVQVAASKGRGAHVTRGRVFFVCVWIVVATATLGLIAFRFVAFLAVITLLVAYWAYSGVRALRIRDTGPTFQDGLASVVGLVAVAGFVVFIQRTSFPWVPVMIYSTLGTLATVCMYDLARFAFPREWFQRLWLREHIVKMLGAHGALAAAFSGTVLSAFQPFSQIAPSVIWTLAMVVFAAYHSPRWQARGRF